MNTNVNKLTLLLMTFVAGLCNAANTLAAADSHALADISATAVAYVEANATRFPVKPRVLPGKLDSRLRLNPCDQPLQAFESPGGIKPGRMVVAVACQGERPWRLFVPVEVQLPAKVIALSKPLRRGDVIAAGDLTTQLADLAELRGQYFLSARDVIGQRIKRHLPGHTVLTAAMIDADKLVKRGSRVTILSDTGGISVRVAGKALRNGARGDQIRVKNLASGRTISAYVVDRGIVKTSP